MTSQYRAKISLMGSHVIARDKFKTNSGEKDPKPKNETSKKNIAATDSKFADTKNWTKHALVQTRQGWRIHQEKQPATHSICSKWQEEWEHQKANITEIPDLASKTKK